MNKKADLYWYIGKTKLSIENELEILFECKIILNKDKK